MEQITKEQESIWFKEHYNSAKANIENLLEQYENDAYLKGELKKLNQDLKGMKMFDK